MSLPLKPCLELLQFFPRCLIKLISNNAITFNNVCATIFICPSVRPETTYNNEGEILNPQWFCSHFACLSAFCFAHTGSG